jgi:proliferating cell nuclear antigen PCNA
MPNVFKAETSDAYHIKVLAEILANNIKTGYFDITNDGIYLRMMDNPRHTLIDLFLDSKSFTVYKFKSSENIHAGLNMSHFHKMLKSIKKKDTIQLIIEENDLTQLKIRTIPKETNASISSSYIKIQDTQNLDIDLPENHNRPIIILSSEFQKMCKNTLNMSNIVQVDVKNSHIKFTCDAEGVMKRTVEFGGIESEDSDDENTEDYYSQRFTSEHLSRITKISGLASTIQIFPSLTDLLFSSNVGELGKISIYIKSKEQIEKEELRGNDSE